MTSPVRSKFIHYLIMIVVSFLCAHGISFVDEKELNRINYDRRL